MVLCGDHLSLQAGCSCGWHKLWGEEGAWGPQPWLRMGSGRPSFLCPCLARLPWGRFQLTILELFSIDIQPSLALIAITILPPWPSQHRLYFTLHPASPWHPRGGGPQGLSYTFRPPLSFDTVSPTLISKGVRMIDRCRGLPPCVSVVVSQWRVRP